MRKIAEFIKCSRLPFFAGVLIGTSYIPFPPWAILFAYVPLMLAITRDSKNLKQAFMAGWVTQFTLSMIGFHWIAYTAHEFGGFPWSLSVVTLLLFSALIHLHVPLAALATFWAKRKLNLTNGASFAGFALTLSILERIWPMIFPWHLGYTLLWAKLPAFQWADAIGFWGLSSLILLGNAWIAWIWLNRKTVRVIRHSCALAAAFVALNLTGMMRQQAWLEADERLNMLAVQGNIGDSEKVYAQNGRGFQDLITHRFVDLTLQGYKDHPEADLAVWPETALPDYPDHLERYASRMKIIADGLSPLKKSILTGAYAKDFTPPYPGVEPFSYNGLFLLNPFGEVAAGPYRKTMLLAFGEYLPFSEEFPILLKWLPFISNFGRGKGPQPLPLQRTDGSAVYLGGQICYDGLFPQFSRGLSEKGAQIMVNVTNDSWFGTPFEPRQHMYMTLARAIEVRLPLLRVTNTGITSAILASGQILQQSPNDQEWVGLFSIPYRRAPEESFYTRYGHFDWVLLLIALGLILAAGLRNVRASRP